MHSDYYIDDEEVEAKTQAAAERLTSIARLMTPSDSHAVPAGSASGRNVFVRAVDVILAAVRGYAPPVHWLVVVIGAIVLLIGPSRIFKPFTDPSSIERARRWLQETLNVPDFIRP